MDNKTIEAQLTANAKTLEWGRLYLHNQELKKFRKKLISNRIKLKRLLYANSVNPAVTIFGESQVGKSYMVDCLLKSDMGDMKVYDGRNQPTDFIESINPLGGGKESTSLISRFTTAKVWENPDYPIKATMLLPLEVIIVLLDGYYNDVENHDFPNSDEIDSEIERLKNRYSTLSAAQDIITEDEIYELADYMSSNLVTKGEAFRKDLKDKGYFEHLALLINHIDVKQWPDVFEFLWNRNKIMTDTFRRLITLLEKMKFSRTVYIKTASVLNATGTILQVDRIYELFNLKEVLDEQGNIKIIEYASEPLMDVYTSEGQVLTNVPKSEFCALAMELAFTVIDTSKDNTQFLEEKAFLRDSDILDFPGARSRLFKKANLLTEVDICEMILRGKVAYLFNKYSQQYLITNLLFCHHDQQSNVNTLSGLLQNWVENTVGRTAALRDEYMSKIEISPLFLIGTKFNNDLKKPVNYGSTEDQQKKARENIWTRRFSTLTNLIAPNAINDWFTQWTPGVPFKNTYLLRSFKYSAQDGTYVGYQQQGADGNWHTVVDESGKSCGETGFTPGYENYIRGEHELKKDFLSNTFAIDHFANALKSYDEATELNKDGSQWIIENLKISCSKLNQARGLQFARIGQETLNALAKAIFDYYHDDNNDIELRKQLKVAGSIALSFDKLFGSDKYFFSDFISKITIDEEHLHDIILDTINDTKVVEETDLSVLFAIRAEAKINPKLSFDENKELLKKTYVCSSDEELDEELTRKDVKLEDIINPPKVMSFSRIIADAVEREWFENYLDIDRYKEFIDRGLDEKELKSLLDNIKVLYTNKIELSERIADKLHPFVSSSSSLDEMTDMLADISSEMINKFINTMGSAYYDDDMWDDLAKTVEHNAFDINVNVKDYDNITFDSEKTREDLPSVFDTFDNVDKILNEIPVDIDKLRHFSNYMEYSRWREVMRISFLATHGIPKYDIAMNDALRKILVNDIVSRPELDNEVKECQTLTKSSIMAGQRPA